MSLLRPGTPFTWWAFTSNTSIPRASRSSYSGIQWLGYSRARFALFTLDQTLESFLRGHGVGTSADARDYRLGYRLGATARLRRAVGEPEEVAETSRRAAHQGMRNRAAPPNDTGRTGVIIALGLVFAL